MFKSDTLTHQVLKNCHISDARYAGLYSICGLALRLRDLYKWEKGLAPWIEKDTSEISEWIGEKESVWDELYQKDFSKIAISGLTYDPFDTGGINAVIESHGLLYGAGYAHSLKPTFFLAAIEDKKEIGGHPIYMLGRELARDLFTTPALCQDNCILIRKEAATLFLWDKIFFIKKSSRYALKIALEIYGLNESHPEAMHGGLGEIVAAEIDTYIYHELGELNDTIFDRTIWQEMIAAYPRTAIEFLVRAVKDLLADTNEYGTLNNIVEYHKTASLALYVAFLDGFLKMLFPELPKAFKTFIKTGNWDVVAQAAFSGLNTATHYANALSKIYTSGKEKNDMDWTKNEIEKRLLVPLGITKDNLGKSD
jgi:hypothetical protein